MFIFEEYGAFKEYTIFFQKITEPANDKTCNKTFVTSKDSDQPVHPPSIARVFIYPALSSSEAVEGTCNQRRLCSECADAQADLSLRWIDESYCRFCHALAHLNIRTNRRSLKVSFVERRKINYRVYSKYWDTLTPYHICPIICTSLFYCLLMNLKYCWTSGKQSRP